MKINLATSLIRVILTIPNIKMVDLLLTIKIIVKVELFSLTMILSQVSLPTVIME